jgi:hypothetical protein
MLSCTCWEDEDAQWFFFDPNDFSKLDTAKRKRCCSCKKLIDIGSDVLKFTRERPTKDEVEDDIYGEGELVPIAPYYMCETCGEIYLNLSALGYCLDITESMQDYLIEYQEMTGFKNQRELAA